MCSRLRKAAQNAWDVPAPRPAVSIAIAPIQTSEKHPDIMAGVRKTVSVPAELSAGTVLVYITAM